MGQILVSFAFVYNSLNHLDQEEAIILTTSLNQASG